MNKITEIIKKYPKHFSKMISNNVDLRELVMKNTLLNSNASFPEHIYSAVHQISNICSNGNAKKYVSITQGFMFCGSSAKCQCCKQSVSAKVKQAKSSYTEVKKHEINAKREATTVSRYGVTNNGQLQSAINAHQLFYSDPKKVLTVVKQIADTKLANHGDRTFNNRKLAKNTCMKRYNVENTWLLSEAKQNPNLIFLKSKDVLQHDYDSISIDEIAKNYNVHKQTVYHYLGFHGIKDPFKSSFEQEIIIFIQSLGITNIVSNNRKLIGKEIDIFLPDFNLAIEYNGLFWHHDGVPHITKTYHYDKFIACEKKGILLLSIFGNEWAEKKEIWKQKIKSKLQLANSKIFARKTTAIEISAKQSRKFLNENHIQGYCTASVVCALVSSDNEIVAVMTFSKKRAGIGKQRGENAYELVRYATSSQVIGGASKLLAFFKSKYSPTLIYSYSDNRYSCGKLYKTLGFTLEQENTCGYKYFCPSKNKVYHRFNFTKSKLVNDGFSAEKTEREIMAERGFLRIWDCGTRTWILAS